MQERFYNTSPRDYEDTFINAGDSDTKKGLSTEEETGEWGLGCFNSVGSQRKGGSGDKFRDKLPAAHCLEFRRQVPVKKEVGEGGGNGLGWVLSLKAFIFLLQTGILGEVSGEGFSRTFISSPGVTFRLMVSPDGPVTGLVTAVGSDHRPPSFVPFLGQEMKCNRSLRPNSREERPGERLPWGQGPYFPSLPHQTLGPSALATICAWL